MAKRSKLLAALDAHKGKDHEAERQKKLQKLAAKRKRTKAAEAQAEESEKEEEILPVQPIGADLGLEEESEGWESDESELAAAPDVSVEVLLEIRFEDYVLMSLCSQTSALFDDESDSDSSLEENGDVPMQDAEAKTFKKSDKDISENGEEEEEDEDGEDEDDEGGIPLSDIESLASSEKADILPHQRLTINNIAALEKAYKSIALPYSTLPFSAHQAITSADPVPIPDVNDDLNRELAFYKQCLDAAVAGRAALKKEGAPFTRPVDYFAEMVKTEEHMGKIKQKIVDEAAGKKAAAEARRQRDLKKFGKQVQVAKLQERSKAKRDALEKIDLLKRSMSAFLSLSFHFPFSLPSHSMHYKPLIQNSHTHRTQKRRKPPNSHERRRPLRRRPRQRNPLRRQTLPPDHLVCSWRRTPRRPRCESTQTPQKGRKVWVRRQETLCQE